jgi:hypothetical protein
MAAEPHPAKMHAAGGMHFGGGGMHFGGVEARTACLLYPIRAFLHLVALAPRHHRDGGRRVLWGTFDKAVGVDHVDQHVALGVAASHDLHLLEKQRAAGAEHVLALGELLLEADRRDLAAGERDVGDLFGDAKPALQAALFRHREVTGDAVHLGIIEA